MLPNALFESLFKRKLSDSGTVEFLEHLTTAHPYFSPAQYFSLLGSNADEDGYQKKASTTALFFNNPYWLNFQLNRALAPGSTAIQLPENKDRPEELIFEPMHLVDYFASQGIQLSEEIQTGDKLGKQLKSFTEWLKTMKRLNHAGAGSPQTGLATEEEPDQIEKNIQLLAEKSNKENAVVTEAMAEVLAKQGLKYKAIELYEKLSLLDPSKIAYFAGKIEQLKGS